MKDKNFKLTIDKLRLLVAYKKTKEDMAIPSGKAALITRYNETNIVFLRGAAPIIQRSKTRRRRRRRRRGRAGG